jgi:hypothetical protein
MHVRCVDTTGLEESNGCRNTKVGQNRKSLNILARYIKRYHEYLGGVVLTAVEVVPPWGPAVDVAGLKLNTMSFLRRSRGGRVSPSKRSFWNLLIAVGAVNRSLNSCALFSAGRPGVGVALGWAT